MSKLVELEVKPENSGSIVAIPVSTTGSDGKATSWAVRDEKGATLIKADAATGKVTLPALEGAFSVPVYDDDAARDAAIPSPLRGMLVYNHNGTALQFHNGSSWVTVATS